MEVHNASICDEIITARVRHGRRAEDGEIERTTPTEPTKCCGGFAAAALTGNCTDGRKRMRACRGRLREPKNGFTGLDRNRECVMRRRGVTRSSHCDEVLVSARIVSRFAAAREKQSWRASPRTSPSRGRGCSGIREDRTAGANRRRPLQVGQKVLIIGASGGGGVGS